MSEIPQTEPVTDQTAVNHTSDLLLYRPSIGTRSASARDCNVTVLLAPTPSTQPQPNEQFYCTVNEPRETRLISSKIHTKSRSLDDEQGQEKLPPKQAAEVAAAARFISKIDIVVNDSALDLLSQVYHPKPRLGSTSSPRDSLLDTSLHVSKSRALRAQMHPLPRRTKVVRPPPLDLNQAQHPSEDIQSPLPTRTSSKGAPSFHTVRTFESASVVSPNTTSPVRERGPISPLPILTPESANTFHFDFSIPSEPHLSRSASGASDDSQLPPTPPARSSDDQLRRDIEAFALEQGLHLRGSERRTRRPPDLEQIVQKQTIEDLSIMPPKQNVVEELPVPPPETMPTTTSQEDELPLSPGSRRKKSMFGWLQKKPEVEVDDLIDLYMTDEQRQEVKVVRRKPSRGRLVLFRNRVTTDPLPGKAD